MSAIYSTDSIWPGGKQDLPCLNAVLKEGLRLCPPFPWILPRVIPDEEGGDKTICGTWLPAGFCFADLTCLELEAKVSLHTNAIHRNPEYFHDPESFLPDHWLPGVLNPNARLPFAHDRREAMQSFLVGPRACIGQNLAWAEMRLIIAKLVWSFDLGLPDDRREWVRWEGLKAFIVMEKPPINETLKLRQN
ncbi:hypothetical protein OQA88_4392 [Cercophora sp. LCS_1]